MKSASTKDLSLPLLSRKESIKAERDDGIEQQIISFAMMCLLSFLLFLQFSISFVDTESQTLISTKPVNLSVFLFFMTSLIYREMVKEAQIDVTAVHLVPELIALATIGFAYSGHAMMGFVILLVGKLVMAGGCVTYCAVQLLTRSKEEQTAPERPVDAAALV